MSTPQRAAIYVRVSTAGQEDGTSLDTQEAACRHYAVERAYAVADAHIYREVHTGAELWERPRLTALREAVRAGEVGALVAYAVDRLSREQAHLYILDHECERAGVALLFATEEFDKTPVGKMIRSVKGFAAELEREKIRERTMRGKAARVRGGRLMPSNRPLYGYDWADEGKGRYIIAEERAAVVRGILAAAARGRALRGIADDLIAAGIPTPHGGRRWVHTVVRGILTHEGYKGVAIGNRTAVVKERGKVKKVPRAAEERIALPAGTIPAIVPAEVWDGVQERLRRNKAEAPRNNRDHEAFLLRAGFVRCGHCGNLAGTVWENNGSMTGKYPAYRVSGRNNGHHGCPSTTISARKLDAAVWANVAAMVTDPRVVAAQVERLMGEDRTAADLAAIDRARDEVRRKQANLGRALALVDDPDAAAPLMAELRALGTRGRHLDAERGQVAERQAALAASRAVLAGLHDWIGTVAANLDDLDYGQRRDLLTALDVRVTLHPAAHTPRWEMTSDLSGVSIVDGTS